MDETVARELETMCGIDKNMDKNMDALLSVDPRNEFLSLELVVD